MIQFLGSLEVLIADVQNVTSSEISSRHLMSVVESELRGRVETDYVHRNEDHMDRDRDQNKKYSWGSSLVWFMANFFKWSLRLIVLSFVLCTLLCLFPNEVMGALDYVNELTSSSKTKEYNLSSISWLFSLLQLIRRSSTRLNLEALFPDYNIVDQCLIPNPLFIPDMCSACDGIKAFVPLIDEKHKGLLFIENGNVTLGVGRLQQLVQHKPLMLNQHTVSLTTNCNYISTIDDLRLNHVLDKLEGDEWAHIAGQSLSYMASHVLRNDCPRPQDFLLEAAQTYRSYFYVDGKLSSSFTLQSTVSATYMMYIQTSGSRKLIFNPPKGCNNCHKLKRVMTDGNIVVYSSSWRVVSEPVAGRKSVAFVDNFENLSEK